MAEFLFNEKLRMFREARGQNQSLIKKIAVPETMSGSQEGIGSLFIYQCLCKGTPHMYAACGSRTFLIYFPCLSTGAHILHLNESWFTSLTACLHNTSAVCVCKSTLLLHINTWGMKPWEQAPARSPYHEDLLCLVFLYQHRLQHLIHLWGGSSSEHAVAESMRLSQETLGFIATLQNCRQNHNNTLLVQTEVNF